MFWWTPRWNWVVLKCSTSFHLYDFIFFSLLHLIAIISSQKGFVAYMQIVHPNHFEGPLILIQIFLEFKRDDEVRLIFQEKSLLWLVSSRCPYRDLVSEMRELEPFCSNQTLHFLWKHFHSSSVLPKFLESLAHLLSSVQYREKLCFVHLPPAFFLSRPSLGKFESS